MKDALWTDLEKRLCALRPVIAAANRPSLLEFFDELLDHCEYGLAFGCLADYLADPKSPPIDKSTFDQLRHLYEKMQLADGTLDRLRSRLQP
jgi:hypothetical protein